MATRKQFKTSLAQRRRRRFSESFKREKVKDLELGIIKVSDICKEYDVSDTSVYAWISKFGIKEKTEWLIMESKSDTKKLLDLQKKVAELERTIGQKQVLIDFQDKLIELAEEEFGIDIKKNYSGKLLNTSGKTERK